MFEVNDEFEVDADFLDKVFASEKEALEKPTLPACNNKQSASNKIIDKSLVNSICRSNLKQNSDNVSFSLNNAFQENEDRNLLTSSSTQDATPKRSISSARFSLPSKIKRQRKFPGPAGLLPERNHNSFNEPSNELDLDVSSEVPAKDEVCFQNALSGSSITEDEPWQNFLSDLGTQQEILKVLNVASIKKKAAARLLAKRKVPFLAAVLHYIDASAPDPCIILRDTTGEIHGTLHRNVWDEFGAELKPGCVVVLRNVGVLSTGFSSRRHYLNITGNNLVTLYAPSQGKVQVSKEDGMTDLNFLKFIENWRSLVNPVLSPLNIQSPCNALSLFNVPLLQTSSNPQMRPFGPKITSGAINSQTRTSIPRYASSNFSQLKSTSPQMRTSSSGGSLISSAGSSFRSNNNISTSVRGTLHNSSVEQPLRSQNMSHVNIISSSAVQSKTPISYSLQKMLAVPDNPNKRSESKQNYLNNEVHTTVTNNNKDIKNQIKFSQNDFTSKHSQDSFLSCSLNSNTRQRLQPLSCNNKKESENTLSPLKQPKILKISTDIGTSRSKNNGVKNNNSAFIESNKCQNIFSFSNQHRFQSENQESSMHCGTSQNTLVFSRALEDDEKSVVESVLDGIDSDALFDDF